LRDLCRQHGCRFQAIDLRWGVREEAALDQQTMRICLDEVGRSQRASPRPNFLVLLGDRYGWRPLPALIPARDFAHIDANTPDANDRQLLAAWYRLDANARRRRRGRDGHEPVYCLVPRGGRFADFLAWEHDVERPLRAILIRGLEGLNLTADERLVYEASATELEIAAGALSVPDAEGHVFCFFRHIDLQVDQRTAGFVDLDPQGSVDREAGRRLRDLKRRLEGRLPGNIHRYAARWQGDGPSTEHIGSLPESLEACRPILADPNAPQTLCVDVWKRLARAIEDEVGRLEQVETLEREVGAHLDFARDRSRIFVGRRAALDAIAAYLSGSDAHPLALWGQSGSGKSALLAKAAVAAASQQTHCTIVSRYIGATPASSEGRSLLESVCRQITRIYGGDESTIPSDYQELAIAFVERMTLATADRPLIVILDALDQLADTDYARHLTWLPSELPAHVHLVVSTLPGECWTALQAALPAENLVKLEPMSEGEAGQLLDAWLEEAGRTLQPSQRSEVLAKFNQSAGTPGGEGADHEGRGMPLYLKLAFDEARSWASYTPPVELALGVPGLVRQLIGRLSSASNHGEALVSRSLGYLAAARHGLSEDELLDVLAGDPAVYAEFLSGARHIPSDLLPRLSAYLQEVGETRGPLTWLASTSADRPLFTRHVARLLDRAAGLQFPVVLWSRLYFDLEPYLTERGADGASVLSFFHRQLREAAEATFLAGDDGPAMRARLAEYFARQPLRAPETEAPNVRKLSELPYQQTHAGLWNDLHATLTDFDFLEAKLRHVGITTIGHGEHAWTMHGGVYDLVEDYRRALAAFDDDEAAGQAARRVGARHTQREDLLGWMRFILTESHILRELPSLLFQETANQPDSTAPAATARRRLEAGLEQRPWLRWVNKHRRVSRCLATLIGHQSCVNGCAFLPDGRHVVSFSWDRQIRLWDADTGQGIRNLVAGTGVETGWAVSPDGTRLLAGADECLVMWDARHGGELRRFQAPRPNRPVTACAFSPDGTRVAAGLGAYGTMLVVWDAANGQEIARFDPSHEREILACTFSPDGTEIATGSKDKHVKVWDLTRNAERLSVFVGNWVDACSYSPNGDRLAIVDGTAIVMLDSRTGKGRLRLSGHRENVTSCAYSPDGRRLLSGSVDRAVIVWDATTGERLVTLQGHGGKVLACGWSPDGRRAVSAAEDDTLRIWDTAVRDAEEEPVPIRTMNGELITSLDSPNSPVTRYFGQPVSQQPLSACLFTPRDRSILTATSEGTLRRWDAATARQVAAVAQSGINACACSPDGTRVTAGSFDLEVWDLESGVRLFSIPGHGSLVRSLTYSPDGREIAAAWRDNVLRTFNAGDGRLEKSLHHDGAVEAVEYSADGRRIACKLVDGALAVWDPNTGTKVGSVESGVAGWALSPDGRSLVMGSADSFVTVRDLESDRRRVLAGSRVTCWAVAPDWRRLAVGRGDALEVVDIESGGAAWTAGTTGPANRLVFSPDGTVLARVVPSGVEMWDTAGASLMWFKLSRDVRWCGFSPDGAHFGVGTPQTLEIRDVRDGARVFAYLLKEPPEAIAWSADGTRMLLGWKYVSTMFDLLWLENPEAGPVVATAWTRGGGGPPAIGCPLCRRWSEVSFSMLGHLIGCPRCAGRLRVTSFTLDADWRGIANPRPEPR